MRWVCFWIGLLASALVPAQDIDIAVLPHQSRPLNFLDQIRDGHERAAFLRLYKEQQPARKRVLAEAFLQRWPQSWLLATVYEIAAKACIELDDFDAALRFGNASLRLLPENPLLLVPLANVEAKRNLNRNAARNARLALEYLDRFNRPSSIAEAEWPEVERGLRASSHFVLGRVAAAEALSTQGGPNASLLHEAMDHLTRARQLNGGDQETVRLLEIVALALKTADRTGGQRADLLESTGVPADSAFKPKPRRYAGSESCRKCHAGEHAAWELTGMARMFRPYRSENVIGEFGKHVNFPGDAGRPEAWMWMEKGRHYVGTKGPEGELEKYPVDYTIGSKWQQAYATQLPDGRIQVFPAQYNTVEHRWLNYWKVIDPPGSERTRLDGFYRMSPATNYQLNCAPCHTSQLASEPDSTRPQDMIFLEAGINCEMCHGPSGDHATAMTAGMPYAKRAIDPPVDFRKIDHREYVDICAQCHMQSAVRERGPHGEWNYSTAGDSFVRRFPSRPLAEFSGRAFYKDGRLRETTFIAEALMRSACYRRGQAHCGHCHNPHPADAATNPASLKYRDNPDRMCLQCHTSYADRMEAHTHHSAASEGSRCVNCHMPRIMNSVLFVARTHQIDDKPSAEETLRFGQLDSPNACLLCHGEKDAQWVAQRLQSW